jgi:hypothetical protein
MNVTLKDHEQRFADSPEGQSYVARARRQHQNCEAYKGASALPWTDSHEATAIQRGALDHSRGQLAIARNAITMPAELEKANALRDAAAAARKERISNGWRN